MNAARTITLVFGYAEIVTALKAAYPGSIHVQGVPVPGGSGVSVETTEGKGLILKYTTKVAEVEAPKAAPMLLLTGPSE